MEILIVLVVVAVMTALAMPWILGNMESYRVRVAAWELAGDLRLARQRAVSLQQRHRICFAACGDGTISPPTGGYLLERNDPTAPPPGWVLYLTRDDVPNGVSITDNAGGKFTFEAKGEVNGGTTTLTNLAGSYQVKTLSTGRVRVCKGTCP
ncbi:MAG: GspH/FimT family pseudopilin [candidate division NC10 bacterium]